MAKNKGKMPEHWHALPQCALFVSILAQMPSNDDVTPWRHDILFHNKKALCNIHRSHHKNNWASRFSKWRPWPLTYDLRTHPSYYQKQCSHHTLSLYLKRFRRESADRRTDRHTGSILYPRPLTLEGKNKCLWNRNYHWVPCCLIPNLYLN